MKLFKLFVLVSLLALTTPAITFLEVEPANAAGQSPVTAYSDGDFTGVTQDFEAGLYNIAQLSTVGDDKISSIKIAPGYRVTLYKDPNFSGANKVLYSDTAWTEDFNDQTSSLKVELIGAVRMPVTAYTNAPYGGLEQAFGVGSFNYAELQGGVGNDSVSSIRIAPGYKVTLYQNSNFSGLTRVLTADSIYLGDFNDRTSSLKVEAVSPLDATSVAVPNNDYSDASKRQLLETFAPRIWMAQGETYFPSSVEFTFPYVDRYLNSSSGKYEIKTKTPLDPYTLKLPYFSGDLANAPIYAFWVDKDYNNVDMVFFQFSPYDLGKTVFGNEVGDHVGDWERITVRLAKFVDNYTNYLKPVQVFYGAHSFGTAYNWDEVTKINQTHPVGYTAFGSHGMWKDPGTHVYQELVLTQLTDVTNQGTAWDTWNNVQAFQYYPHLSTGNGLGNPWPTWLDKDYTNPNSLAVSRFGNPSQGSYFGQPLLAGGPTGPQEKYALINDVVLD